MIQHAYIVLVYIFMRFTRNDRNRIGLPVVRAGVHSCSPVAPHSRVRLFDGVTVTSGPAAECSVCPLRRWIPVNRVGLLMVTQLV